MSRKILYDRWGTSPIGPGVPAAVAAELIAEGKYLAASALAPEAAFEPELMFSKLGAFDLKIKLAQKQKMC